MNNIIGDFHACNCGCGDYKGSSFQLQNEAIYDADEYQPDEKAQDVSNSNTDHTSGSQTQSRRNAQVTKIETIEEKYHTPTPPELGFPVGYFRSSTLQKNNVR